VSTATVAGLLLVAVPLAFNAAFALLAARFEYVAWSLWLVATGVALLA
jgi:hypothetical protein